MLFSDAFMFSVIFLCLLSNTFPVTIPICQHHHTTLNHLLPTWTLPLHTYRLTKVKQPSTFLSDCDHPIIMFSRIISRAIPLATLPKRTTVALSPSTFRHTATAVPSKQPTSSTTQNPASNPTKPEPTTTPDSTISFPIMTATRTRPDRMLEPRSTFYYRKILPVSKIPTGWSNDPIDLEILLAASKDDIEGTYGPNFANPIPILAAHENTEYEGWLLFGANVRFYLYHCNWGLRRYRGEGGMEGFLESIREPGWREM